MIWSKWAQAKPKILPSFHLSWLLMSVIGGVVVHDIMAYWLANAWLFWLCSCVFLFCISLFAHKFVPLSQNLLLLTAFFFLGIAAASIELHASSAQTALQKSEQGVFSLHIQKVEQTSAGRLRLTGKLADNQRTDTVFQNLGRIRVSILTDIKRPQTGDILDIQGRLFPLSPPVFPNAPDYAKSLWLKGITATGIGWRVLQVQTDAKPDIDARIERYRQHLSGEIVSHLSIPEGYIASTMLVGVRDGLSSALYEIFRKAGLSHLLAISGLHMGIFCFLVLAFFRRAFALFPKFATRYPVHKFAALAALAVGFCYLLISGVPISALRAFLMASLFILAILADRVAFTQRNLALVGLFIILPAPSVVFSASFQLSFIATFALIFAISATEAKIGDIPYLRKILFLSFSSALIILFSMIFVVWHFASLSPWGVLSNVIAIPFTAFVIMPLGVLMLISTLFDASFLFAPLMEIALRMLLNVARFFAELPFADITFYPPPYWTLFVWPVAILFFLSVQGTSKILSMFIILSIVVSWAISVPPIASLHMQSQKHILVWQAGMEAFSSGKVSEYWQRQIARYAAFTQLTPMMCEKGLCRFTAQGKNIGFVDRRYGLTPSCKMDLDLLITLHKPHYPCRSPNQLLVLPVQPSEGVLIRPKEDGFAFDSNLERLKWRPWRRHLFPNS